MTDFTEAEFRDLPARVRCVVCGMVVEVPPNHADASFVLGDWQHEDSWVHGPWWCPACTDPQPRPGGRPPGQGEGGAMETYDKMNRLLGSFPTTRNLFPEGWQGQRSADHLAQLIRRGAMSSGERHAALFCLGAWNFHQADALGGFHFFRAMATFDHEHRAALAAYAADPFFC